MSFFFFKRRANESTPSLESSLDPETREALMEGLTRLASAGVSLSPTPPSSSEDLERLRNLASSLISDTYKRDANASELAQEYSDRLKVIIMGARLKL